MYKTRYKDIYIYILKNTEFSESLVILLLANPAGTPRIPLHFAVRRVHYIPLYRSFHINSAFILPSLHGFGTRIVTEAPTRGKFLLIPSVPYFSILSKEHRIVEVQTA